MAPYLAQAYRENSVICFELDGYVLSPYYFESQAKNNPAFLEAINRYLEPDEQLTKWVFEVNWVEDGTILVGMLQHPEDVEWV